MMRSAYLLQLGAGRVGAEVQRIVQEQAPRWQARDDIAVRYAAVADSTAFLPAGAGTDAASLATSRADGRHFAALPGAVPWAEWPRVLHDAVAAAGSPDHLVVLDCAVGRDTTPLLLAARAAGAHVVLANKDPLVGPQSEFDALRRSANGGSLQASATVGAGLPILVMLQRHVASGDVLLTLSARASGSLGFLCDQLSGGAPFDDAVRAAEEQGFTEPDPRQDLSGFDVARKLLILARTADYATELASVRVESLVPPGAASLPLRVFRAALPEYAGFLADRVQTARAAGRVLRYAGRIMEDGTMSASLVDLPPDDPLARGSGPENIFVLRTRRYDSHPITIAGPGAGVAVTAGAVVADCLRALGVL